MSNPGHEAIDDEIRRQAMNAYNGGWADAVRLYAVWRDGEQIVGVMGRPLKEVLAAGPGRIAREIGLHEAAQR